MHRIVMRLKSGREFAFDCESYKISTFKVDGSLSAFSYEGGQGDCPIYYNVDDVEAIVVQTTEPHGGEK